MSKTNETKHVKWPETGKCKCRLDANFCKNKQRSNGDNCRCECKELIDKGICDKVFIWNPSDCEYECDKSCDAGEYLDYANCKCRKKLVDKLVEECTKHIDEEKIAEMDLFEHRNDFKFSCTIYVVLIVIVLQSALELVLILFTTST